MNSEEVKEVGNFVLWGPMNKDVNNMLEKEKAN